MAKEEEELQEELASLSTATLDRKQELIAKQELLKNKEQRMGKVTVFFCGNPSLARILRQKCDEFGFTFKKEVF